jgi:hypothetical protein
MKVTIAGLCGLAALALATPAQHASAAPFADLADAAAIASAQNVQYRDGRWRGREFRELDPGDIVEYLHDRGYYDVNVREGRRGFRADGCREGRFYEFRVTFDGEIVDRERVGRCDDDRRVRVDVPGVDLDVDRGVRLRVPGVDLRIP